MADDEDYANAGQQQNHHVPAAFDPLDTTVEIPHPKRFVFVMPSGRTLQDRIEESTLMTIKHPRHGAPQMIFVNPDGNFFEVQEHHRRFAQTWVIGDLVEPRSPMYVVTPLDVVFIALYVLRGCVSGSVDSTSAPAPPAKFLDAYTLLGKCMHIVLMPPVAHTKLTLAFCALADIVDVDGCPVSTEDARARVSSHAAARGVGGDAKASENTLPEPVLYFRFSEEKCVAWLKKKYQILLSHMQACADKREAALAALQAEAAASSPSRTPQRPSINATEGVIASSPPNVVDQCHGASSGDVAVFSSPTRVIASSASAQVSLPPDPTDVSLGLPRALLEEKAAQLIAEYLDRANEPLVLRATDGKIDLAAKRLEAINLRRANNSAAATSRAALGAEAVGVDDLSEPNEKKKRVEIKSASVKKLEKAGAPKGTPTLFAMFAKKAPAPAPTPDK